MSPEKAKVFVSEDNKQWQDMIRDILQDDGHSVVASAKTLEEALALSQRLGELGVNVATIDGNLSEWDTSGADGQAVLRAIRASAPGVKTVGLSGNRVPGVDIDLGKANCVDLSKTVKKL